MSSCLPSWLECRPDQPGYALVRPHQRVLSFDHAPFLSEPLLEQVLALGRHSVLIDFIDVEYLSSDVVGALMSLSRRLRDDGGRVLMRNLGPVVREVFTPFPDLQRGEPNRLSAFMVLEDES
jgi:anti-anti-sigma regulatory factor